MKKKYVNPEKLTKAELTWELLDGPVTFDPIEEIEEYEPYQHAIDMMLQILGRIESSKPIPIHEWKEEDDL